MVHCFEESGIIIFFNKDTGGSVRWSNATRHTLLRYIRSISIFKLLTTGVAAVGGGNSSRVGGRGWKVQVNGENIIYLKSMCI